MTSRHQIALALLSLPVAAALVACGANGNNADRGSTGDAGGPADAVAPATGGIDALKSTTSAKDFTDRSAQDGGAAVSAAAPVAANSPIQRAVIATGALRLTTSRLADARQDAINLVTGLGGNVANEQSLSDTHGRLNRVDLSLRVPVASFGTALDGLAALGTVRHREQSAEDVTTQVIDNAARVKAQRASVESIERLLARASTIGEIMSIERQLASRQADLDSLEQQEKWLADQTSLSTIQVTLTRPASHKHPQQPHAAGFLGGLDDGWHALGRTTVAVGTAVGAVLPFAALLALVGWPVGLLVRRRRVAVATTAPES